MFSKDPDKPTNSEAEVVTEVPENKDGEEGSREGTPFMVVGPKGRVLKGPKGGRGREGEGSGREWEEGRERRGRGAEVGGGGKGRSGNKIFDFVSSKFDRRRGEGGHRGSSRGGGGSEGDSSRQRTRSVQRDPDGENAENGTEWNYESRIEDALENESEAGRSWECDPELLKELESRELD